MIRCGAQKFSDAYTVPWWPWPEPQSFENRYFMSFWRWFDSGLLTDMLTLLMVGRVAECGAMYCGEKVTFRSDHSNIF